MGVFASCTSVYGFIFWNKIRTTNLCNINENRLIHDFYPV